MPEYSAESIRILEGLEPVRSRPGMFIGSTGPTGLHHLVWEAVDNSIDEAMAGYCDEVTIIHHLDGSISVEDNGRGIPVAIHPTEGVPAVQVVMTKLHAGGKFDEKAYGASGGLHGVGISCVNALSEKLFVTVWRDKAEYQQTYERGTPVTGLLKVPTLRTRTGTRVQFWPDPTIFETTVFDEKIIATRLKELSYLNPGLKIIFVSSKGKEVKFISKAGLVDYVDAISSDKEIQPAAIQLSGNEGGIYCFIALRWTKNPHEEIRSFCNNINTIEGGTHLTGFKTGLTRAAVKFLANYIPKNLEQPTADDIREGLAAVVSVRVPQPQFEGQTKAKLGTSIAQTVTGTIVYQGLNDWFENAKKDQLKLIADRIINATKARLAAQRARDNARKVANLGADTLPGKLTDCQSSNPAERELFLVEGDSAGGSAKQARDRRNQAILPLRGKILNCEKANLKTILKNTEVQTIIAALGLGIGTGSVDLRRLRYHKVIIMTDADVDGCLAGDTKIKLLDGTYRTMEKLATLYPKESTRFWVWADDGNGRHIPAVAHSARITRYVSEIYEIMLDDGSTIRATENHPFMLRTGEFIRTDKLTPGMSLMRMTWRLNGENTYNPNREELYIPADKNQYPTHRYVASCFYNIDGLDVHHKDGNPQNNTPENLEPMAPNKHRSLHAEKSSLVTDYNGSELQRERIRQLHREGVYDKVYEVFQKYNESGCHGAIATERNIRMWKDPDYQNHMKKKHQEWLKNGGGESISKNVKKQWEDKTIAFRMQATRIVNVINRALRVHGILNRFTYESERPKTGVPKYENMMKKMGFRNVIEAALFSRDYNHKVKAIRLVKLPEPIPVYDLTVEKYHNFLVCAGKGSGVFVHNSHIRTLLLTLFFRHMPELILGGYLYIAQPPLYRVKAGKTTAWAFNDKQLKEILDKFKNSRLNTVVSRFKGLGEMPPEVLWKTTMNPENRILIQVDVSDSDCDDFFQILMGDQVEPRAEFITKNSLEAQIDI